MAAASAAVAAVSAAAAPRGAGESWTGSAGSGMSSRPRAQRCSVRFRPRPWPAIEAAIAESERRHSRRDPRSRSRRRSTRSTCWRGQHVRGSVRSQVFAALGVWDTEANNGVLIYVLLADRDVEIVADRGYNGRVSAEEWAGVCRAMESSFRDGRFEQGALEGVRSSRRPARRTFSGRSGRVEPTNCRTARCSLNGRVVDTDEVRYEVRESSASSACAQPRY